MATYTRLGHQRRQLGDRGLEASETRQVPRRHDGAGHTPHRAMVREVDPHAARLPPALAALRQPGRAAHSGQAGEAEDAGGATRPRRRGGGESGEAALLVDRRRGGEPLGEVVGAREGARLGGSQSGRRRSSGDALDALEDRLRRQAQPAGVLFPAAASTRSPRRAGHVGDSGAVPASPRAPQGGRTASPRSAPNTKSPSTVRAVAVRCTVWRRRRGSRRVCSPSGRRGAPGCGRRARRYRSGRRRLISSRVTPRAHSRSRRLSVTVPARATGAGHRLSVRGSCDSPDAGDLRSAARRRTPSPARAPRRRERAEGDATKTSNRPTTQTSQKST